MSQQPNLAWPAAMRSPRAPLPLTCRPHASHVDGCACCLLTQDGQLCDARERRAGWLCVRAG